MNDNKQIQISTSSNNVDGHDTAGAQFPRHDQARTFKETRAHIMQGKHG